MRKPLLKLLIGLLCLGAISDAYAQSYASYSQGSKNDSERVHKKKSFIALEDAFRIIKSNYNINLIYEGSIVSEKFVELNVQTLKDKKPEVILTTILRPLDLDFVKIDQENYSVFKPNEIPHKEKRAIREVEIIEAPEVKEWVIVNDTRYLKVVKGKVIDAKTGETLPGVSVNVKGTVVGTSTDAKGLFSISVPAEGKVLVFNYLGYVKKEVVIGDKPDITVAMDQDAKALKEVVVTGLYERKKDSFTGAVTTITADQIRQVGSQNVLQAVNTLDPSFRVLENLNFGSDPNALPEVNLRGQTAFSTNNLSDTYGPKQNVNQPLFVLDGFEVSLNRINDLDISRVETVTLLKDASASAIYGSRAANGVLVITTRQPTIGKLQISYRGDLKVSAPDLTSYNLLNADEKLQLEKNAGLFESTNNQMAYVLQKKYNGRLQAVQSGVNTDWISQPVRTGMDQKHSLYMMGGDEIWRYGVNFSVLGNNGVMKGSSRNTIAGGVNLSYRIKNVQFKNDLQVEYNNSEDSPYGSFKDYAKANPYLRVFDENGNPLKITERFVNELNSNDVSTQSSPYYNGTIGTSFGSKYFAITNNFTFQWNLLKNLNFISSMSLTKKDKEGDDFMPAQHTSFLSYSPENYYRRGTYDFTEGGELAYEGKVALNGLKQVGRSLFYATLGGSMRQSSDNSTLFEFEGFPNENANDLSYALQYKKDYRPFAYDWTSRLMSAYSNINYSFDDKYLADFSLRSDGSSQFGADDRFATFWSVGTGWNIHKESFMKNVKWVNYFKLRASIGTTGSQNFYPYQALATYLYLNSTQYRGGVGAVLRGIANSNLKWPLTYNKNVGIDLNLFGERLNLQANIYNKTTKALLAPVSLPASSGFPNYQENLGETVVNGYEVYLNVRLIKKKDLTWSLNFNAAHQKDKITKVADALKSLNDQIDATKSTMPQTHYYEGQSQNDIYVVRSLGIDPSNGMEIFQKKDGTLTYVYDPRDNAAFGNLLPTLEGNFGSVLGWKNLGMRFDFSYSYGSQIYNQTLIDRVENANPNFNVDRRVFEQRWVNPGDVTFFKDIKDKSTTFASSRFVQDFNWMKLNDLNIWYDFAGTNFARRLKMPMLRLGATCNDVFYISTVKRERGLEYPFARTYSVTLQASF